MISNRQQTRKYLCCLVAAMAMQWSASASATTTIVDIPNGTSWEQAFANGNITPSANNQAMTQPAQQFYLSQTMGPPPLGLQVMAATLTPDVDGVSDGTTTVNNTLVMSWELPTNDALAVAWWDYRFYPGTNGSVNLGAGSTKLHFSLYPPPGVWDVSLELIDINGYAKGWFQVGPANAWGNFWITPSGGLQDPFNVLVTDPLFDITRVVAVRFDESGMWSNQFPINPTTGTTTGAWNAWNSLVVEIPEPTSIALLGLSLAAMGVAVGRRRREATTDDR